MIKSAKSENLTLGLKGNFVILCQLLLEVVCNGLASVLVALFGANKHRCHVMHRDSPRNFLMTPRPCEHGIKQQQHDS